MGWFHAAYAAGELGNLDEGGGTCALPPKKIQVPPCPTTLTGVEVIYHMTEKSLWEQAVKDRGAYFPPTFHKDGKFTRASVYKEGLMEVANHFYKDSSPADCEWICLELNLKLLLDLGIVILPQPPQDETATSSVEEDAKEEKQEVDDSPVQCFQVYAGITTIVPGVVMNVYSMKRGGCGTFLSLEHPTPYKTPQEKEREREARKEKEKEREARRKGETVETPKTDAPAHNIAGIGSIPPVRTNSKSKGWFGSSSKK
jgi:hypothetical protein